MALRTLSKSVATLVAAAAFAPCALAESDSGQWYATLTASYNLPRDSEASLDTVALDIAGDIELDDGIGFALALGRHVTDEVSVEVEAAYRAFDVSGASGVTLGGAPQTIGLSGEVDTWTLMVNGRYEMGLGFASPYLGAGLGLARHDGDLTVTHSSLGAFLRVPGLTTLSSSGDDTVFAYQLLAGVGFEVGPNMDLIVGYRYLGSSDLDIEQFTASYATHALEAGLRLGF